MSSSYEEIMKTKPYQPLIMGGSLTEAMVAKAREELGETEEMKAKTIPELRKLVQNEPGLTCPTDDAFLLQYLRPRKFNVQRAFSLLRQYFLQKKANADIFGSFHEEAVKRALDQKAFFALPYRDEEGCAIVIIIMQKWNIDVTNAFEAVFTFTSAVLMCAQEPATQVCGVRILVDARGVSLKQVKSLVPRCARLFADAIKNFMPIRYAGIHLYNESPIFHYMWTIFRLFLTEKIKNRIHLHGDSQKHLHKFIPKAILPAENFGGDNPNDVADWFNAEEEKYFDTFRQLISYGYMQ